MRFIFTADWHLKVWNDKEYIEGHPRRLIEIIQTVKQMCNYARENGINHIIVGGDVNDLKNVIHVKAFVLLKKELDKYRDINFIFLHGNHDSTEQIGTHSAIHLLDGESNITTIVSEPVVAGDITYIPYHRKMVEWVNDSSPNKVMVGHFGLNEAMLSNGYSLVSPIKLKDVMKFNLVLLGHYHKPQNVEHVYYAGSPIQLRRDEAGEEKRFLVVDTEDLSNILSVPTEGYRKYIYFEIKSRSDIEPTIKKAEELMGEGNFVYIKKEISDTIEVEGLNIIDCSEKDFQLRGITSGMPLEQQIEKYLEIENIDPDKRDLYKSVCLEMIN